MGRWRTAGSIKDLTLTPISFQYCPKDKLCRLNSFTEAAHRITGLAEALA
jgi:hypothetical protein